MLHVISSSCFLSLSISFDYNLQIGKGARKNKVPKEAEANDQTIISSAVNFDSIRV